MEYFEKYMDEYYADFKYPLVAMNGFDMWLFNKHHDDWMKSHLIT